MEGADSVTGVPTSTNVCISLKIVEMRVIASSFPIASGYRRKSTLRSRPRSG